MTIEEYFGDWSRVIDLFEANNIMLRLKALKQPICPKLVDVFKCFRLCKLHDLRVVIIGQDPYPNYVDGHPVATGLAFANSSDTTEENYSPSLKVLRDSFMDFSSPQELINFDPSLESWEKQGVLLLNTALSCLKDRVGSHTLLWRPFITSFLSNLSKAATGIVYVLMGSDAMSLEPYINKGFNHIFKTKHPAYYARTHSQMPNIWIAINKILIDQNGYGIKWYNN
jgi:uracil-DNA glycosylase